MKLQTIVLLIMGAANCASDQPTGTGTKAKKNDEARLIEYLLNGYESRGSGLARPVADYNQRLLVTLKFVIHEYQGINDVTKRMELSGLLKATWQDLYLGWNPADYGGIKTIPLRGDNIYLPVIVRQSSSTEMSPIFSRQGGLSTLIWVDYEGNVFATVAGAFKSDCQIDLLAFPFDNQTCDFVFQVWQHSDNQVSMKIDPIEPITFMAKTSGNQAMWVIDSLAAAGRLVTLGFANFSSIVYTIKTTRRSNYYIWNLIVPCAMLSTVQLAAFFMPYGPERVMFAITLVLSLHLFQDSVSRQLPATAEPIPILKYSGSQMMIGIMVTVESVFMIYALELLAGRQVPAWLSAFRNRIYTRSRHWRQKINLGSGKTQTDNTKDEIPEAETFAKSMSIFSRTASVVGKPAEIWMSNEEKEERKDEWRDTILMFDRMIFIACLSATIGIPASVFGFL